MSSSPGSSVSDLTPPHPLLPRLHALQLQLLDLTRRNRLLNFRPDTGASSLTVVDELPAEVFRLLAVERRPMQFLSREEAPAASLATLAALPSGDDAEPGPDVGTPLAPLAPLAPLPPADPADPAARHRDKNLQTTLPGEKLQTRLLRLAQQAGTALEEQGSNILYLTLGAVAWRETPASDVLSLAPLLLLPVELERKSVGSRHTVRLLDEDIVANPSLLELAKRMFGVTLPAPELTDDFDLGAYFRAVGEAVAPLGWRVEEQIHLGLFSFSKLLMYRDLDPASWPEGASVVDHPLVQQLLGAEPREPLPSVTVPDPSRLDDAQHPTDMFQVLDADASQQVAIVAAWAGASGVIEGPPGTGKSQTITNVIAECLARGQRVLFVAEKAAALEVVRRRLANVGLGDFVLELHSRKTSKATVLAELGRCLARVDDEVAVPEVDPEELARLRARANVYVRELHLVRAPLELSAYDAMSRLCPRPANRPDFAIPGVREWSRAMLARAREQMSTFDQRLRRAGDPAAHPWRALAVTKLGAEGKAQVLKQLAAASGALAELRAAARSLAAWLAQPEGASLAEVDAVLGIARQLCQAPSGLGAGVWRDERWGRGELDELVSDGQRHGKLRGRWRTVFSPDADAEDWSGVFERRARGPGLFRWLGGAWRADTRRLRAAAVGPLPPRALLVEALTALVESAGVRARLEARAPKVRDLLETIWAGLETDWEQVAARVAGTRRIQRLAVQARLDATAVDRCLGGQAELARAVDEAARCAAAFRGAWAELTHALGSSGAEWMGTDDLGAAALDGLAGAFERAAGAAAGIDDWVAFQAIWTPVRQGPLAAAAAWAMSPAGSAARGNLAAVFEQRFYELWLASVVDESATLGEFHGEEHGEALERFKELDRLWIEATRTRVADVLRGRRPELGGARRGSKLGVLEGEIRKKRRHLPLRRLFDEAGEVVQAVKPCFMMSPVSVAQYLVPGRMTFDVVIFDEASQVEPADAFGAIARGRQVLLVGDEKQLPPTAFFKKLETDGPAPAGGDEDLAAGAERDLESILGLGVVRLPHRFTLRWHYRSRHETLIAFSNQQFYGAGLRVFPSAHTGREEAGVQLRHVGGTYLRGKGRTNPEEVRQIVDEIARHAHERPDRSLGVGTFNKPQEQAIRDELERRRRGAPDERLEAFLAKGGPEPFFVKNLENIQGDERDVILLSVTYGPDPTGRVFGNFGPLNSEGGWRRLNVLVTRARERCVVFSSLRADDIALGDSPPRGVVALKEYLAFAERGVLADAAVPSGGYDSPLEEEIADALRGRGWEVRTQIGVAGFSIDLAIVDPDRRGRFLCGIECDGATYHSSPTARDRDRLRQEVLENLGWRIVRVWSTDWFKNRERALERLLAGIEEAKAGVRPARPAAKVVMRRRMAGGTASRAEEAAAVYGAGRSNPEPRVAEVQPYVRREIRLRGRDMNDTGAVVPALIDLVRNEGPIHVEEAGRVLCKAFGTRLTEANYGLLNLAVESAIEAQAVERAGGFLRLRGAPIVVRFRGADCPVTKPELIPPEEYQEAVRLVLKREFGLQPEVLHSSVVRLMGFERAGERLKDEIGRAVRRLVEAGEIAVDGRGYVVSRP